ncbi:hypothetical protein KR018_007446 [Drosophila ironensis]|nr:hypothetical protein KR018_007446 [Drosophila ironensis]
MGARRLYRLAMRVWMVQALILGLSSHFYSRKRKCLVHSRFLQVYQWLLMASSLGMYYIYWGYAQVYFVKNTFRRQDFVSQISEGSVRFQLITLVVQVIWKVVYEQHACRFYSKLSRILHKELRQKEPSDFYYGLFFVKFHNYLHNFNFGLSVLMILGLRTIGWMDIVVNIYFIYTSVARESILFAYVLLLLNFGEALRLNSEQEQDSYAKAMAQLRRQERLLGMLGAVHRIFAWQVATALLFQLYFNTCTIYLGYSFVIQRKDVLRADLRNMKLLFTCMSLVVRLLDSLLLQIACEHLLAESNRLCAIPKVRESPEMGSQDSQAAQRQWEMSVLRSAIRRGRPQESRVLGMFRMDMRSAFVLLSSSLAYGTIIIQLGYVRGPGTHA